VKIKTLVPISKNFSYACSICGSVNAFRFKKSLIFDRGTLFTSAFRIRLIALSTALGGGPDDSKKQVLHFGKNLKLNFLITLDLEGASYASAIDYTIIPNILCN